MEQQNPEAAVERTADELEHDIERLDEHIDEAKAADKARQAEFPAGDVPAGDVSGQEGGPMFGEDAEGAGDDGQEREAAREE